jgi:hypothetical protein
MADEMNWDSLREFTREGLMVALPLCFPGQSVPPPAGETAAKVMALHPGSDVLYLGTEGEKAHLLAAMIHQDTGIVHDLGTVPEATSIDGLSAQGEEIRFLASGPQGCTLYSSPAFRGSFFIQEWGLSRRPFAKVAAVLKGQGAAHAVVSQGSGSFLGVTAQSGEVFQTDLKTGKTSILGALDPRGKYARRLALDRAGHLWGTSGNAQLWCLDPARGQIERLPLRLPGAAGREQHTQASAWALDPFTGTLYGGTRPDGFLFKLDPETRQLVSLGKPCRQDLITCLTVGNDGRVFGMAGTSEDIGHSFCYDPATGALVDLGIPVSTLAQRQYGYHYACAVTGNDGEIYFGQHERVNFLWVYFPAVPRRATQAV